MSEQWKAGDVVALRGIYNQRVSYMQSAIVVRDAAQEVALAVLPGAECSAPTGYIHGKHGATGHWDRWEAYRTMNWQMEAYRWRTNRVLILLQPDVYYATMYFWQADENQFLGYYVNFQRPFQRTGIGFDTLDLELDILVEPTLEWRWKDLDDFQRGIECGILLEEWVQEIDKAKLDVLHRLEKRQSPFDGSWLDWMPDPAWAPPRFPANWDKIEGMI